MQIHPDAIGAAYENADLYQDVYPSFHYGFSRLRAGQLPLWNAKQLCGTPFLAQPSSAIFQPLNAVFLFLATEQAMAVHAFLCLAMMGIGFVAFARALDLGYTAALIGGTLYAFCGASAAAASRPGLAAALAWTPFLFWGIRETMRQAHFGCSAPAGLAGAALALSGAPALSALMLATALAYGVFLGFCAPREARGPGVRERFERLLIVAAIAIAVSAVQWLPTAVWLFRLDRPWDALWATGLPAQVPMSLQELLAQLLVPKPGALPQRRPSRRFPSRSCTTPRAATPSSSCWRPQGRWRLCCWRRNGCRRRFPMHAPRSRRSSCWPRWPHSDSTVSC
ncbi:MAG: hypothetical protein NTU83_15030 [Candidatus Hydrogenedentes bacterium]|nr:hypothetical protein [Candidatus Hydrogenedentota bacterium]